LIATFLTMGLFSVAIKGIVSFNCRGASIRFHVSGGGFLWRLASVHCLLRGPATVAFDIHLKDRRVMNEPVDGGQCHGGVGKDRVPFPEGLVCRDEHGATFISCADEFEEHAGLRLVLGDVCDVIENQKVELIELRDGAFEDEIAARLLEFLDQIGGATEENAVALLDEGPPYRGAEMGLADPWRAEQQYVAALSNPAVASGNGADMSLGEHRDDGEVEGIEGLAGQQVGLCKMSLDTTAITFGQFMLHQGAEEARSRPAFFIGLFGKARPECLNRLLKNDFEKPVSST